MENDLFKGFKILIAEDNFINYTLLKELIDLMKAEPFWAKNGIEAIEMLAKHENISLILMDINIPEMDGISTTRKIREKGINIPIIFQTDYFSEENKKECIRAGGNEFLYKPLNIDRLRILLKKYLIKV